MGPYTCFERGNIEKIKPLIKSLMKLTGFERKMKRAIDLYENLAINSKF